MRSRLPLAALAAIGLLVPAAATAAPSVNSTVTSAPTPPPTTPLVGTVTAPPPTNAPKATADSRRMYAATFTNMVVYENGAGYLHAFWRTLGSTAADAPARLQWGRGCPEISDRVFMAIHTAFTNPDRFFLIVDKAPDARQPGAFCVTGVELEAINPPKPPPIVTPPPTPPAAPPSTKPVTAPPPSTSPKPPSGPGGTTTTGAKPPTK